jgi:hypothetical protein
MRITLDMAKDLLNSGRKAELCAELRQILRDKPEIAYSREFVDVICLIDDMEFPEETTRTPWDDILDTLDSHEKTCEQATALLAEGNPALACMLLRDVLRSDAKFAHSPSFVEISKIPELHTYLSSPEFQKILGTGNPGTSNQP